MISVRENEGRCFRGTSRVLRTIRNCDHYRSATMQAFPRYPLYSLVSSQPDFTDKLRRSRANFNGAIGAALREKSGRIRGWLSQNRLRKR